MDEAFWQKKWELNQIGFHESKPHPFLVRFFPELRLEKGARVFVPLCGKSLDIHWLLAHGFSVVGIELSIIAIESLFQELGLVPQITQAGKVQRFVAENICIYAGNIFALTQAELGEVKVTYDRAALIALPDTTRVEYAHHVAGITNKAPMLLITLDYDQACLNGPPFSVTTEEVLRHYAEFYTVQMLDKHAVSGGLKGKCPATEVAWHLASK
ncbi:thiopurine S-methyltransferase [Acetobacter indonesiensis]